MMRRTTGLAIAALALTITSACGGSSSDGDSASDAKTSSSPTTAAPSSAPSGAASSATPAAPVQSVDPDKRPTTKQLSTTLESAGLTAKQASCFAKKLDDSSLPDKLLAAIVNRDATYKPSTKDTDNYTKIGQAAAKTCA